MAPKKDPKGKGQAPAAPEISSLYQKREPLPPLDPPNLEEVQDAWKATRDAFVCPLPPWDDEDVNKTEWNCSEVETRYSNDYFSAKLLPRPFTTHVAAWRRAAFACDTSLTEEPAPEARPPVEKEPTPTEAPKAKAKPAAKDKGAPPASARATTAQQFENLEYAGDACVVSKAEFQNREFQLTNDDAMPPISQAISSQIAVIGEHGRLLPRGCFLWELIYPQNEDGVPLYNPHGKYVVKLFVQGRWRQVLIDDVIPVGTTGIGATAPLAPVLPSSAMPTVVWPQLLAKALLRAFQHDLLRGSVLPAVAALTGLAPFQMPLGWPALRSCHETRPFCCLQMSSKVDLEARQREALMAATSPDVQKPEPKAARKGAALGVPSLLLEGHQMPKLGANPVDAVLQFVVCELEDDPRQVRVKAATWRPIGGTPRKQVLDVAESEIDDEHDEDHEEDKLPRPDYEEARSENEDHFEHEEDEDEERRSQRSPSGEATVQSARSKDDGQAVEEPALAESAGEGSEEGSKVSPWPEQLPPEKMPKSLMLEYLSQLTGGYWVPLEELTNACDSFLVYMPPNEKSRCATLDTTWSKRTEPYVPSSLKLLRLLLTEADDWDYMPTPRDELDIGEEPRERGPPWHKASFLYDPLRLDPLFAIQPDAHLSGPGSTSASCILQNLSMWQREGKTAGAPEYIHMASGDASAGAGPGSACRSVLLPSGEQWYLVLDDAQRAGSVLSVHLDGSMLNPSKSLVEFHDPAAFLQERGIVISTLGAADYAALRGFSVLAKAEVEVNADSHLGYIQLMSSISDATLRPHLRLSFLRLEVEASPEASQRCALWSVSALVRTPLLPFMSLPLGDTFGEERVKYILMLEANVPALMPSGTFSLQLMLPPDAEAAADVTPPDVAEGDEPRGPLGITDLKVDHIIRWSGETKPNEKLIVLRERLTVPHGQGDATATLRVTVTGLPRVFLRANLMAQLPPTQEMRPKTAEGTTPEPFQPGVIIDPKEYSGRQNWLASCKTVVEETGVERVMFPHVLFCEGSTYLLDIFVDPHKGPDKLDGGQWFLEIFGSGEIEVGADTMEEDLEALVRRSWEKPDDDLAGMPPRKERAAKSRKKWLRKRGLIPTSPEDEEEEAQEAAPPAPEKAPAKAADKGKKDQGKRGSAVEAPPEDEVDPVKQEAEWLAAALARAGQLEHSNRAIDEFVHMHNDVDPMLVAEDPYTIAPILEDAFFDAEAENSIALRALGMRGLAEVRESEIEITNGTWEKIHVEVESAKEGNAKALEDLKQWNEDHAKVQGQFLELREGLRGGLQERYQAKSTLKDLLNEAEMLDPARLQEALDVAEKTEVGIWDQDLVETAAKKKVFIESWDTLRERLSRNEAEPLVDAEQDEKDKLFALISTTKDLQKKLLKKGVPLIDEMSQKDLLKQADAALNPPPEADIGDQPLDEKK